MIFIASVANTSKAILQKIDTGEEQPMCISRLA